MNLFIADDEYFTRNGVHQALPWHQFGITRIDQMEDGLQALEVAAEVQPDIVLTDVRMPRMDGIQLAKQLRSRYPDCQIIFMSGYSDKEYLKSAIHLSAITYIEKPFEMEELREAVQRAVDNVRKLEAEKKRSLSIRKDLTLVKSNLALQLIRPNLSREAVEDLSEWSELRLLEQQPFRTFIVQFFDPMDNREELYRQVESTAETNGMQVLVALKDDTHLVGHVYGGGDLRQADAFRSLFQFFEAIVSALKINHEFYVAAGKTVYQFGRVYDSYLSAVVGLQKAFYRGCYAIVDVDGDSVDTHVYSFPADLSEQFRRQLAKGTPEHAHLFLSRLVDEWKDNEQTTVIELKNRCFHLLLELLDYARECGIPLVNTGGDGVLWESIYRCHTLEDAHALMIHKVDEMFRHMREKGSNVIVSHTLHYIYEHYVRDDLSVKEISEHLFITTTHLCVVFKEHTSKTILQYITEYRVDKAKHLLRSPQHKISDIAGLVGYKSGIYFAKIFKKSTGMTPTEYRERTLS